LFGQAVGFIKQHDHRLSADRTKLGEKALGGIGKIGRIDIRPRQAGKARQY